VCAALDDIAGGISKDTEYVFASQEMLNANIHINILIDRLSEVLSDFLLVLDDLHLIDDPAILAGLSYLIDYMPAKMHLIFISRTEPELELARHKVKWQVHELTEYDLRFDEEEILRFYQARGIALENTDLKKVESYTEGWAAALGIYGVLLRPWKNVKRSFWAAESHIGTICFMLSAAGYILM